MTVLSGSAFRHLISKHLQRISLHFSVLIFFGTFFTWNLPILAELLNRIIHGASQSEGRALFDDAVVWSRRVTGGCSRSLDQWQHSLQSSTPDTNSSRVVILHLSKLNNTPETCLQPSLSSSHAFPYNGMFFTKWWMLYHRIHFLCETPHLSQRVRQWDFFFFYQKLVVLWKLGVTYQKGAKVTANVLKQCLTSNVAAG